MGLPYGVGKAVAGLLVLTCWNLPITSRVVFSKI